MTPASTLIEEARRQLLGGADAETLYRTWFHDKAEAVSVWPGEGAYRSVMLDLERFERGWRCGASAQGQAGSVIASREGIERVVAPPHVLPERAGAFELKAGAALLVDPLTARLSGGYWHLWSAGWQRQAPDSLVRVYFNLLPGNALAFASAMAKAHLPGDMWAAKILSGAHPAGRRDGALLYLPAGTELEAGPTADLIRMAEPWCAPQPARLTRALGRGIGTAPDPGGERSFGQAVCEALWSLRESASDRRTFSRKAFKVVRAVGGHVA